MDFLTATKTCLIKFAVFKGRAPRSEYWWFFVFKICLCLTIMMIDYTVNMGGATTHFGEPVCILSGIALLPASWGAIVRRLHDTNHSGWYYILIPSLIIAIATLTISDVSHSSARYGNAINILVLLCIVISIWFIFTLARKGTQGQNLYGEDPLNALSNNSNGGVDQYTEKQKNTVYKKLFSAKPFDGESRNRLQTAESEFIKTKHALLIFGAIIFAGSFPLIFSVTGKGNKNLYSADKKMQIGLFYKAKSKEWVELTEGGNKKLRITP